MTHSKVLITGAAGRIAQWIIPFLENRFTLRLTDRTAAEIDGRRIEALDITDYDAVRNAMEGMDAVVHLAIAASRHFVTDREQFNREEGPEYLHFNEASIDVNVRGTYHVFEAARQAGAKRVIFGSSLTVFFGTPRPPAIHDDLPFRPANFYAVTKMWGEQLGEYFSRAHGLTVYCLRIGTPHPQFEHENFRKWTERPPGERCSVAFADLAGAVEAALTIKNGPAFGAYSIVSDAEGSIYDVSKAAEIGWKPRFRCEADESVTALAL